MGAEIDKEVFVTIIGHCMCLGVNTCVLIFSCFEFAIFPFSLNYVKFLSMVWTNKWMSEYATYVSFVTLYWECARVT